MASRMSDVRAPLSGWTPLLDGVDAERALGAIKRLATALVEHQSVSDSRHERRHPASLGYGYAGQAIFLAELSRNGFGQEYGAAALKLLNQAIEQLTRSELPPDLFRGVAGIGLAAELLRPLWESGTDGDPLEAVDDFLCDGLEDPALESEFMHGLAGIAVYGVQRQQTSSGQRLLQQAVAALSRRSQREEDRAWWLYSPTALAALRASVRESGDQHLMEVVSSPNVQKFGVAHGMSGIVGACAYVAQKAADHSAAEAAMLAAAGLKWTNDQVARVSGGGRALPRFAGTQIPETQRGWCNGRLGSAATLYFAARRIGDQTAEEQFWRMLLLECAEGPDSLGLKHARNPMLCHGHAGWAHVFNRLYQATRDETMELTARRWFQALLNLHDRSEGIGGFAVREVEQEPLKVAGLLMGVAGIGLALIAAVGNLSPSWDVVLCLGET
jgi:lantibiotic biosynthesis protein